MKDNNTLIIVIIVILAFLLFGGFGFGMMGWPWYGGGMMSGYYGTGSWIFGWIFMILITIIMILGIVWLVKQIQKSDHRK